MKKIVSLIMAIALVLTSVSCFAAAPASENAKNNIYIKGSVENYAAGESISLMLEDEDGNVISAAKYDVVKPDGSFVITRKYQGDLTVRQIKLKYAGEDITDRITSAVAVTDMLKADITLNGTDAVVDIKDMFSYDDGCTVMVAAYDENNRLLDCKTVTDKTKGDEEAAVSVPSKTVKARAFCWNSLSDLLSYSKELEGLLPKIDIFCHGDSFGAGYDASFYPESGWGEHLGDYFTDRASVKNYCTSGAWAQSVMSNTDDPKYQQNIADGKKATTEMYGWDDWNDMEKNPAFGKGDYVIVSLGLNDASKSGPDGMDPVEWYGMALEQMAQRAEKKGVNLILCSPLLRATFKADSASKRFAAKTEEIAEKYGIPYLNVLSVLEKQYQAEFKNEEDILKKYYLHRETLMLPVEQGGFGMTAEQLEKHAQPAMHASGSGTNQHPNIKGADNFARQMVECIKNTDSDLNLYIK